MDITVRTEDASAAYNSRISVRAVAVGACVALAIDAFLVELGGAVGVWRLGVFDPDAARAIGPAFWIWTGLAWVVAVFCGAALAARASDAPLARDGFVHGIATWGVATLVATTVNALVFFAALRAGLVTPDALGALDSRVASWSAFAMGAVSLAAGAVGGRMGLGEVVEEPVRHFHPGEPLAP